MEEAIYRWVERFGFPMVMCFILLYVVRAIHGKWEQATNKVSELADANNKTVARVAEIAEAGNKAVEKNSQALERNTASADNMSAVIAKSLGSGNTPICQSSGCQASELKPYMIEISDEVRKLAGALSDAQILDVIAFRKANAAKKIAHVENSNG